MFGLFALMTQDETLLCFARGFHTSAAVIPLLLTGWLLRYELPQLGQKACLL